MHAVTVAMVPPRVIFHTYTHEYYDYKDHINLTSAAVTLHYTCSGVLSLPFYYNYTLDATVLSCHTAGDMGYFHRYPSLTDLNRTSIELFSW